MFPKLVSESSLSGATGTIVTGGIWEASDRGGRALKGIILAADAVPTPLTVKLSNSLIHTATNEWDSKPVFYYFH